MKTAQAKSSDASNLKADALNPETSQEWEVTAEQNPFTPVQTSLTSPFPSNPSDNPFVDSNSPEPAPIQKKIQDLESEELESEEHPIENIAQRKMYGSPVTPPIEKPGNNEGEDNSFPIQTSLDSDTTASPETGGSSLSSQAQEVASEDFSNVQFKESQTASDIGALAYTQGDTITFAPGQFQPNTQSGRALIGHELTHVKQQRDGRVQPTTQAKGLPVNNDPGLEKEADDIGQQLARTSWMPLEKNQNPQPSSDVRQRMSDPQARLGDNSRNIDTTQLRAASHPGVIQASFEETLQDLLQTARRLGLDVDEIISHIPGYKMFSYLVEYDILRGQDVERTARGFIQAAMEMVPGGNILYEKLNEYGIIEDAYTWVETELGKANLTLNRIKNAFESAWDEMGVLEGIEGNMNILTRHFGPLLRDVESFADSLVDGLIEFVKDALINPLVDHLDETSESYRLATKVLGVKFPSDEVVNAPTVEILRDFLLLIGKQTEVEEMEKNNTLQKTADWIDTQLATFNDLLTRFGGIVERVWAAFSLETLEDIPGVFSGILGDFAELFLDFTQFAEEVALKVLEIIKDALLSQLSQHAEGTPGYPLIKVLLGKDPFTEETVERNATNIIHGFLSLLPGGEETFQRLQESGAITRMTTWIEGAVTRLGITWEFIVNLFTDIWNSFSIDDLINPIEAFVRIVNTFGEPIGRLFEFIFEIIQAIVRFVLEAMNFPFELIGSIVENAMQAFEDIKRDPLQFFINLLQAMKLGFEQFFNNIGTHLLGGLTDWLFGQMNDAGITPPTDLSFESILNLVLEILGISKEQIMGKIAERIGPERMERIESFVERAQGIFSLVSDVMTRGPIALWERIEQQLTNLWDMVLENVTSWIMEQIVNRVVARLITMLDPTGIGAAINGAIAFFNAVQSFIEYLTEMLEIVNSFVTGIANIAKGSLGQAANFLENALADGIPIAIGFLANQVGLGGLGERIGEMIQALQERVDRAIDSVLDWVAEQIQNAMRAMGMGGEDERREGDEPGNQEEVVNASPEVEAGLRAIDETEARHLEQGAINQVEAEQVADEVKIAHPVFRTLRVVDGGDTWDYDYTIQMARKGGRPKEEEGSGDAEKLAQLGVSVGKFFRDTKHGRRNKQLEIININQGTEMVEYVYISGGRAQTGFKYIIKYIENERFVVPATEINRELPAPLRRRVTLRESTKRDVRARARRDESGRYIDPNTEEPIDPGHEDFGHKPGHEWRKYQRHPDNQSKTREQVIEDQNKAEIYQIEKDTENRSRRHEAP